MTQPVTIPLLLASDELAVLIPVVAVVGGVMIAVISIAMNGWRKIATRRQYEESRREIAAYVAEGSISPQDAERLLRADMPTDSSQNCSS